MPPKAFGQGADKCAVCDRTVYATEKLVLEGKDSRVVLHKLCFRCDRRFTGQKFFFFIIFFFFFFFFFFVISCKHCNKALEVGKYTAADGQYYCEPHYKQLVVGAGNLDEVLAKSTKKPGVVVSAPSSFVPIEKDESSKSEAASAKQETPAHIAAKFKGGEVEKCLVCEQRVYATERLPIDSAAGPVVLHKACLKCATCGTKLEIGQSTLIDGKFYCRRHAKELQPTSHSNAPGAVPDEKPASAASADEGEGGSGTASNTERCAVCSKRVYATERVPIDTAAGPVVLHKPCLKCADCSTKLEMGAFTLVDGKFYCKRHAKDHLSVSHSNAPGAVPDEKPAVESDSNAERCAVCSKRVYATERVPIDTAAGPVVLHKPCLKCADCSTKLEMGAFTLVDGKFYCKRHAKDHLTVSHSNAPGAIPDEKPASEGAGDEERCLICKKKVFATERMPIDGVGDASVIHRTCLKCSDCGTTLKGDTFTRIGDAFFCKRHAADHASEIAPVKKEGGGGGSEGATATKSIKVDRDTCPICSKAVYATEKLIVSDAFDTKTLHKTCFRCKTCDTKLDMRTYVSIGDGSYYCKPHKPQILRAKGAGDMYAAYGSEYGADAAKSPRGAPQSTAERLEAEAAEQKAEKNIVIVDKIEPKPQESDDEEVQGEASGGDADDGEKERKEREERDAAAAKKAAEQKEEEERAARRAAREKERAAAAAAAETTATTTAAANDEDAERAARRAAREKARADEEAAEKAANEERERKRAERRAAAEAEAKKAEEEAERAAAERKAKREQREKEAAEEAARLEKELADKRAKREAKRSEAAAPAADEDGDGDDGADEDGADKKGSKVRVRQRVRKEKSNRKTADE